MSGGNCPGVKCSEPIVLESNVQNQLSRVKCPGVKCRAVAATGPVELVERIRVVRANPLNLFNVACIGGGSHARSSVEKSPGKSLKPRLHINNHVEHCATLLSFLEPFRHPRKKSKLYNVLYDQDEQKNFSRRHGIQYLESTEMR